MILIKIKKASNRESMASSTPFSLVFQQQVVFKEEYKIGQTCSTHSQTSAIGGLGTSSARGSISGFFFLSLQTQSRIWR